jgi:hypothetical protein
VSFSSTATPPARTRVAAVTQVALAQGGLPVPVSPQAETAYVVVCTTIGWRSTFTRALELVGCACPGWCAHVTVAPA